MNANQSQNRVRRLGRVGRGYGSPRAAIGTKRAGGDDVGYLAAVMVALVLGFGVGLAVFKRSERWCPGCGSLLTELHCPHRGTAPAARLPEAVRHP